MSTGQQHDMERSVLSFESINAHIGSFDLSDVTAPGALQETPADRIKRLLTIYAAVRPVLAAVAAIPLLPSAWRAVVTVFIVSLDEVNAAFKAGKDLGPGGGGSCDGMESTQPAV